MSRQEIGRAAFGEMSTSEREALRDWVSASGIYPFDEITKIVIDPAKPDFYVERRGGHKTRLFIPAMPRKIAERVHAERAASPSESPSGEEERP
jgi:hypothetical protein